MQIKTAQLLTSQIGNIYGYIRVWANCNSPIHRFSIFILVSIQNTFAFGEFSSAFVPKAIPFGIDRNHAGFYPEHISQLSGLSKEHAIAAACSSSSAAVGSEATALSTVNLIASVAAFVLR
jgi:hypothetical protein